MESGNFWFYPLASFVPWDLLFCQKRKPGKHFPDLISAEISGGAPGPGPGEVTQSGAGGVSVAAPIEMQGPESFPSTSRPVGVALQSAVGFTLSLRRMARPRALTICFFFNEKL